MKFFNFFVRHWKISISLALVVIVLLSLVAWTAYSPITLSLQSESQLSGSLFQYAKTTKLLNVTDGEGSYSFLFGIDYNESVRSGVPTVVEVFASLVTENRASSFLKGVALEIDSSTVLIDGSEESGVTSMITKSSGILIVRLSDVDINETGGIHQLSARLIVSTTDVNYIGYLGGTELVVSLNGTISVV